MHRCGRLTDDELAVYAKACFVGPAPALAPQEKGPIESARRQQAAHLDDAHTRHPETDWGPLVGKEIW